MREALNLARKGLGRTSPNPAVGCLIVKSGKIVGSGFHEKAGEAHAEVKALEGAREQARSATMYVTLEPCCCEGRTPPCTDAIIEAGVNRVVIASEDPNPKVSGRGIAQLSRAGIEVEKGILEMEAREMNEAYEKFITTKQPFVIAKAALSADGKMSAADGSSRWITGEEARSAVHDLRAQVDAVMVGIETVLKDDPELTCRTCEGKNPIRIVADSRLRIPADAKILNNDAKTVIATTNQAPMDRIEALRKRGKRVVVVDDVDGEVDLKKLLGELVSEEITSIMVEGGGELIGSALDAGIVDKVMFFISPKIISGSGAVITGRGAKNIKDATRLERVEMKRVGEDFLLLGYPAKK